VYKKRCTDKRTYKLSIRNAQNESTEKFSNDLHEALLQKRGKQFWKCWNSKFRNTNTKCIQVEGLTDHNEIADRFMNHFSSISVNLVTDEHKDLKEKYDHMRRAYILVHH